MKNTKITLALIALALLGCKKESEPTANVVVGDRIPTFVVSLSNGTTYVSEEDKGWTLIAFFNTDCEDCQKELPVIQQVSNEMKNVRIVSIARGQATDVVRNYFVANGLTFPYYADNNKLIFSFFAANTVPRCYLVKDGVVQAAWDDSPMMTFKEVYEMAGEINVVPDPGEDQ